LKKNQLVAGLSTEVEYVAIGLGTQQAIWLWRIMKDVGEEQEKATTFF
jgi:hypothetical protein